MINPICTLNDETEITSSDPNENGYIQIYLEKFDSETDVFFDRTFKKADISIKEFAGRLANVRDANYDFAVRILTYVKENKSHLEAVKLFMDENPDASSSDISEFISKQDDINKNEKIAESSLDHDFVVNGKENDDCVVDTLTKPKKRITKPTRSISGKEAILHLMQKWRKGHSKDKKSGKNKISNTCLLEKIIKSKTTFTVDHNGSLIVVRNVPCMECEQCGDVLYSDEVSKKLEKIVEEAKARSYDFSVIDYEKDSKFI